MNRVIVIIAMSLFASVAGAANEAVYNKTEVYGLTKGPLTISVDHFAPMQYLVTGTGCRVFLNNTSAFRGGYAINANEHNRAMMGAGVDYLVFKCNSSAGSKVYVVK